MPMGGVTSDRPSKIIITLKPSTILSHPLTVLGHKMSVLRFQRSLCDANSTSNGFYRELSSPIFGGFPSAYGLLFVKDLAVSIYKSEGILGFCRCLPEYIAYHLIKDVLRYIVPNIMYPLFSYLGQFFEKKPVLYNILDTNYNIKSRYMGILEYNSKCLFSHLVDFYKGQIKSDKSKILTSMIVEAITYPILTIISRLIIYDGFGPVSFHTLFLNTLSVDGFFSLYRGFIFHLFSNSIRYFIKHFDKFIKKGMIQNYYVSSVFEQSFPVILSISQTVVNQFSMILRCGSSIDGFCIEEDTINIFRQMPWVSIGSQMIITIGLLQLKEKLLRTQIEELNARL